MQFPCTDATSICIYSESVDSPRPEPQKDFSVCGCTFQRLSPTPTPPPERLWHPHSTLVVIKSFQWD